MTKTATLFIVALLVFSCAQSQIYESTWIDKETEKTILKIEERDGKFWLNQYNDTTEIVTEGSKTFVKYPHFNMPFTIDSKKDMLTIRDVQYVLLPNSLKGKFTGKWKDQNGDPSFLVQIDQNNDLNWDIISDANKLTRYYPKPTEDGFHFTMGKDTLSYKLVDGFIIDNEGNKYSKDSNMK